MAKERDELLAKYSARVFKNRKQHITQLEFGEEPDTITANTRAIPGVVTARGCCYAGCKGVVVGPMKDTVVITHGPIGCAFYSWGTRRNKAKPSYEGEQNYVPYSFCTDMRASDIVFGGEKKLEAGIEEIVEMFHPKAIFICSTCPIGLIGDDVQAVARRTEKKYGITSIGFSCEGYKGVSQSAGHHIANNGFMKYVIGKGEEAPKAKYNVNILGEYNIGGDGWEQERILRKIGYNVVAVFTGDGSFETMKNSHLADLNLVMCHRSINYIAEMMKTKYGIDWIKVNFIGVGATCKSLRMIAEYFNDPELTARTEEVIAEELASISEDMEYYKSKLKGKTAGIFVGGSRSHHYQMLLQDFGVETTIAGYEFAHRDDYEGRKIIPEIKPDADSKNIEVITVEREEGYTDRYSEEQLQAMREAGVELDTYDGMFQDMKAGDMVVDDYNLFETDQLIEAYKPDIFFSGIKDKYAIQHGGVVSRQMHSYDYSGPYAGFRGAVNFGRDVTMSLYANAWSLVKAPWKTAPMLEGTIGGAE